MRAAAQQVASNKKQEYQPTVATVEGAVGVEMFSGRVKRPSTPEDVVNENR